MAGHSELGICLDLSYLYRLSWGSVGASNLEYTV